MTASCVAITAARLASIAASQSAKKLSGASATPSRDSNSYTTIFRTPCTSDWSRCFVDERPGARSGALISLVDAEHALGYPGDLDLAPDRTPLRDIVVAPQRGEAAQPAGPARVRRRWAGRPAPPPRASGRACRSRLPPPLLSAARRAATTTRVS